MEVQKQNAKRGQHKDVYGIVTDSIIEKLEKGIVPWHKTWTNPAVPTNLASQRPYRILNFLLLAHLGYEKNYFLTSKQLKEIGGSILPEEKPHLVVIRNFAEEEPKAAKETVTQSEKGKASFLRYYTVYNVSQCVGIPDTVFPSVVDEPRIDACEHIVSNILHCPSIKHKDANAYYDPLTDVLNMPRNREKDDRYYSSLFHQLVHSTGHYTRLDRIGLIQMSEYGCEPFTLEELVAEIGTSYLQSVANISVECTKDADYAKGWIEKLKGDRYLIFTAAALAQKAVDFVLNTSNESEEAIPVEDMQAA